MKVLAWGLGLVALVFVVHLVIWRVRIPVAGRRFLGALFLGALPVFIAAMALLGGGTSPLGRAVPATLPEYLFIAAVYLALSLAYLALYVPIEGDSPSLTMIRLIEAAEPRGVTPEELERALGLERHLGSRVRLLLVDGMAQLDGERYRITAKGRRLLGYYARYAAIAGTGEQSA